MSDDSNGSSKLELAYVQGIFDKLGMRHYADAGSKERLALAGKLADSIFADIEAVAKEARETMKREAGYWRYVSRRTYNAMVRNHEIVNWETGEKLVQDELDENEDQEHDDDWVNDANAPGREKIMDRVCRISIQDLHTEWNGEKPFSRGPEYGISQGL